MSEKLYGFPRPEARKLMEVARMGMTRAPNDGGVVIPERKVLNRNAYIVQPVENVPEIDQTYNPDASFSLQAASVDAYIVERDKNSGFLDYRYDNNGNRVLVSVCNLCDEPIAAGRFTYAIEDTFGTLWIVETCAEGVDSSSGIDSDSEANADGCCGVSTVAPIADDCCPPGYVKISTKKFIDLVRYDGDDCTCTTDSIDSGDSTECGEEPSWANDPCDFTCFRFDPANIKNACANECPCTADDIDAAALDGNPLTRYLAADLPEYPDGDDSLITTTGEVYYTTGHWLWKQKTGSRYEYHFRRDNGQFQIIDCTADVASIVDSGNGLYLINALGDEYTIEIDGCGGSVDSSDSGPASTFCPEEGTACILLADHTPDTVRVTVSHPEVSDRCRVCDQQETQGVFDLPQTAACNWQANIVTDLCVVSGNNATIQVQIQDNGGGSVSVVVSMYNSGGFNAPCFATDTVIGSKVFPSGFDGTGQHSIPITTAGLNQAGWPYDWENVTFNVDFGNGDACP